MKRQFKIYKQGVTDYVVNVVSFEGQPFDVKAKMEKYLSLGYLVFTMDWKEVTND